MQDGRIVGDVGPLHFAKPGGTPGERLTVAMIGQKNRETILEIKARKGN